MTRVARLANERTRSFGVAFTGCTLPGAEQPLFSVPEGRMAIGLGIHGEPGIDETDIPTADGLAELLVSRLLDEVPEGVEVAGARVVPILNGLGSLKYEEMFVVYRRIAELLREAGIELGRPARRRVLHELRHGRHLAHPLLARATNSSDLWDTPVDTPAYRRGSVAQVAQADAAADVAAEAEAVPPSDEASRAVAATVASGGRDHRGDDRHARRRARSPRRDRRRRRPRHRHAARIARRPRRGDRRAGCRSRSTDRARPRRRRVVGPRRRHLRRAVGTSSSRALAGKLGDEGSPSAADVAAGVAAGVQSVMTYGKAEVGDKTLVDALVPFSVELTRAIDAGASLAAAWAIAADAATRAAASTADLLPRMGRARPHAEKSLGTPDPGAHSLALIATAVGAVLERN